MQDGNPLIGQSKGDTIDGICDFLEWMLLQATNSGEHPGMIAQLSMLHGAALSLQATDGE